MPAPELDAVFHALADGTRRSILREIAGREKTVGEIARPFAMSLAAVSKHLKVLERADLITRDKRGSFQYVRTNAAPMKQAQKWLSYYEQFWTDHLDRMAGAFKEGKNNDESLEHEDARGESRAYHRCEPGGGVRGLA